MTIVVILFKCMLYTIDMKGQERGCMFYMIGIIGQEKTTVVILFKCMLYASCFMT